MPTNAVHEPTHIWSSRSGLFTMTAVALLSALFLVVTIITASAVSARS